MAVMLLLILPVLNLWKIRAAAGEGDIGVSEGTITDEVRTATSTKVSFPSLFSLHLGGNSKSIFPCPALLFQIPSFS